MKQTVTEERMGGTMIVSLGPKCNYNSKVMEWTSTGQKQHNVF